MSCESCGGADTTCADCADKRIAALKAQLAEVKAGREADAVKYRRGATMADERLAEVTKERDFERRLAISRAARGDEHFAACQVAQLERNTLRAEVARLRAAIEPTEDQLCIYQKEWPNHIGLYAGMEMVKQILAAIRARAGEVSAPGSSLRERVEAAGLKRAAGWCDYYLAMPLKPGAEAVLRELRRRFAYETEHGPLTTPVLGEP